MATHPGTPAANPNGAYPDQTPSDNLNTNQGNSGSPNEGYTGTGAPNRSDADDRLAVGLDADEINRGGMVTSNESSGGQGNGAHVSD